LVAGAEQRCQIADRAQVGLRDLSLPVDLGLLDLEFGQDLVCMVALGGELRPVAALVGNSASSLTSGLSSGNAPMSPALISAQGCQ
jgi:hypothetical protein